jgi:penicillin-binding protein 2
MRDRTLDRTKKFSRRALLLAGGKAALLTALVGRLYYLQVIQADRYTTLAEDNRINLRLLPPPRGRILDRLGQPFAENRLNYRVVMISEQTESVEMTLDALGSLIPISDHEYRRVLRESSRKRGFVPITVREDLTWAEVSRVEVNAPDLPGVMIDVGQTRHYPLGPTAAHLIGYVAAVSEDDLTGDPLLELPDFRIGKNGIEKIYDRALRGSAGDTQVEVNAYGRVIRELRRRDGQPGDELMLTVDIGLQQFASERLGEESASAVVIDIHSGDVLALVSTPSFNPDSFNKGLSNEEWRELVSDPRKPLIDKAIAGQYPPGSTFKMMVALAALEGGVLTPEHRVFCSGQIRLGDRTFHCWKRGGHGELHMVQAIERSCDVYFYDVARRAGIDRIAAMARRFGLGAATGIDLPGESTGLVPNREWKLGSVGVPWQQGETLVAGIGQGYLLATPLQLAVMAARIANGGIAVTPRLVRRPRAVGDETKLAGGSIPSFERLGVSPGSLNVVVRGMRAVTNSARGTAYRARITEDDMKMAGKTGTSQVRRISKSERIAGVRKNEAKPWVERDHALFVAFAPVQAPRYAVAVVVEHGGSGSRAAAPLARDILRETQRRAPTPPGQGGRPEKRPPTPVLREEA